MKSTTFYVISLIATVFVAIDVFKGVFGTALADTSGFGLSYAVQLGILGISTALLIVGIIRANQEDKELWGTI